MTSTCILPVKNQDKAGNDKSGHSSDDTSYKVDRVGFVIKEVDREAVDIVMGDLVLELRHPDQILGKEGRGPGH